MRNRRANKSEASLSPKSKNMPLGSIMPSRGKGIRMKKQIKGINCLVALVVLPLMLCSCTGKAEKTDSAQGPQSLKKTTQNLVKQQKIEITLPDKKFANLISMDEDYYYFVNDEAKQRKYLRVDRSDTSKTVKLPSLGKGVDINLQHGHDGNVYVGAVTWLKEKDDTFTGDYDRCSSPAQYKIMKLTPEGDAEEIFSCESMGMPPIVPCGGKAAIEVNDGKHIDLKLLDFDTKKTETIFQSSYERNKDGLFNGTILMGMDALRPAASTEGICYQTCSLENEGIGSAKAGDNHFYYYDLESGATKEMSGYYRPVEFVGGSDKAYIVSGYPMDQEEQFVRLYAGGEKNGKYQAYVFDKEDMPYGIIGSVFLNDDLLLAHDSYDGYYVMDLQKKAYSQNAYAAEGAKNHQSQAEDSGGNEAITGFAYEKGRFAFSCLEGDKAVIYEVTAD